jgi:hypothetical protein
MVRALDQVTSINVLMETEQMSHSCLFWETLWQLTYGGRRAYIGRGTGIGILVSIVVDTSMPLRLRKNASMRESVISTSGRKGGRVLERG